MSARRLNRGLAPVLPVVLAMLATAAAAHETWFAPGPDTAAPRPRLALGTGEQYPVQQSSPGLQPPPLAACSLADGRVLPMSVARDTPAALLLDAPAAGARQCWASVAAHEVTLTAARAAVYLDEIRAPDAVRQAWAARVAQLGPAQALWRERFVKNARIVLAGGAAGPAAEPPAGATGATSATSATGASAAPPLPLPLDILPEALPAAPGGWLRVQVLRDGQPLPGLNLQVASAGAGLGFWLRSDAQGRAALRLPLGGAWLVRGTELRTDGDGFASRWATLALEVAPR